MTPRRLLGSTGVQRLSPQLLPVRVKFFAEVGREMKSEVEEHPDVEVGGKYVGRIHGRFDAEDPEWRQMLGKIEIEVIASLDAGANATRTPTYHLPDGEHQENLFRRIESIDPLVEHLGSWHSHHPNGYPSLSAGDVDGYFKSVNDQRHNLDLFMASLITDATGLLNAQHFLFIRGCGSYFRVDPHCVGVVDRQNPYVSALTANQRLSDSQGGCSTGDGLNSSPALPREDDLSERPPRWWENEAGRENLRNERDWVVESFEDVVFFLRNGCLGWRAQLSFGEDRFEVEYTYPKNFPEAAPTIRVSRTDGQRTLDLAWQPSPGVRGPQQLARIEALRRHLAELDGQGAPSETANGEE